MQALVILAVGQLGHPSYGVPLPPGMPDPDGQNHSQPEARALLPPGASIWKGRPTTKRGGSWSVHLRPYPRFSRSWAAAGSEREALAEVLRHAWSLWCIANSIPTSDVPIAGLF